MGSVRCLHHLEMVVRNAGKRLNFLKRKFGFQPLAECRDEKWAVSSCDAVFLVSERPALSAMPDSVTDAAFTVSNVEAVVERVARHGGTIVLEPCTEEDAFGSVQVAKVKSIVGNVVHTLLDTTNYTGPFLPSFTLSAKTEVCSGSGIVNGIDHVTFVCDAGKGADVARWYEDCFGMKRLMSNRLDDPNEGIRIEGNVGLRLRAMQYWKCAELGVCAPGDVNGGLRLVIAESLWPERANAHVEEFLVDHIGPGIQHVGLTSDDICRSVEECIRRGVQFRHPPPSYYSLDSKKLEIARANLNVEELARLGILIDGEADPRCVSSEVNRFLLQIFTLPIFDEETFFMEIIQRKGASGFGEGNVTALALSIDLENQKKAMAALAEKNSS